MSYVTLEGFITVPEDELETFTHALVLHKQLTLQEPGCITFRVEQDEHDPCRFRVQETFVDRAAFDHHQQRTASSHWGRLTRNARREYEVTE